MINPPISTLLNKVDSRYTLVVLAAKRARQLVEDADKFSKTETDKPVSTAINEIYENRLTYIRTKSGVK